MEENLEISNTNTNTLGQLSNTLATGLSHGAMKKKITQDVMEQRGETEPQIREDKHGNYRNAKMVELRFNYPELEPLEQEEYPSNKMKTGNRDTYQARGESVYIGDNEHYGSDDRQRELHRRNWHNVEDDQETYGAVNTHGYFGNREKRGDRSFVSKKEVTPEKFDGRVGWGDYQRHFEACKMVNKWSDRDSAYHLATRLQGPALKVLGSMPMNGYMSYGELIAKLTQRFGPGKHPENYLLELRMRKRKQNETLQEIGQEIRDLTSMAYPELPREVRERLAKGHFLDAMDDPEIRAGIFRSIPETLDDAIRSSALETECFLHAEHSRDRMKPSRYSRNITGTDGVLNQMSNFVQGLAEVRATLAELMKTMQDMKKNSVPSFRQEYEIQKSKSHTSRNGENTVCFECGKVGHFARNCPTRDSRTRQYQMAPSNNHRSTQRVERWPQNIARDPVNQMNKGQQN